MNRLFFFLAFYCFFLASGSCIADEKNQMAGYLIDLGKKKPLYESSNDTLYISSDKVDFCVAIASFFKLGTSHRFQTSLCHDGKVEEGVLKGNVYLKGSGDPSFCFNHLKELSRYLTLHNLTRIEGALYVDDTIFEQKKSHFADEACGLNINHNYIHLDPPLEGTSPSFIYETIPLVERKQKRMGESSPIWEETAVGYQLALPVGESPSDIFLDNPALISGYAFYDLLKKKGICFTGKVFQNSLPTSFEVIAEHSSKSLSDQIYSHFREKDPLLNSALLKKIAAQDGDLGTSDKGLLELNRFFQEEIHLNTELVTLVDDGIISNENLIKADQLCHLVEWVYQKSFFFYEVLAALPREEIGLPKGFDLRITEQKLGSVSLVLGYLQDLSGHWHGVVFLVKNKESKEVKELIFQAIKASFFPTNKRAA